MPIEIRSLQIMLHLQDARSFQPELGAEDLLAEDMMTF